MNNLDEEHKKAFCQKSNVYRARNLRKVGYEQSLKCDSFHDVSVASIVCVSFFWDDIA